MKNLNPIEEDKQHQESYVRKRDNPYFDGIRKDGDTLLTHDPTFDLRRSVSSQKSSSSSLDISNTEPPPKQVISDVTDNALDNSAKNSASDLLLVTNSPSPSGTNSVDSSLLMNSVNDLVKSNDSVQTSISTALQPNGDFYAVTGPTELMVENLTNKREIRRTYSVDRKDSGLSKIPLPRSAALFYRVNPPQMEVVESCLSIHRINQYLKARMADLRAGIPGKFLHAVIGQEVADVGSIASTIIYAFYLNETLTSSDLCTVPVINIKREDVNMHCELKWLLKSCQIDQSSLIFIDEIDLSYYDSFGCLKLVLLNGHKLPTKLEALKEAVVEIFNCKQVDSLYPWVETITFGEDCSCCTLVAEKFALTTPEILAGHCLSRLLLAGILVDTGNLTNVQSTSKDKYMATLLIKGAGRFGCNGLYQILKYKIFDVSELKVRDILRKDFKKWTRVAGKPDSAGSRLTISHIGMSSIGISIEQLLAHDDSATQDILEFQQLEKLRLLMIVSGYYDIQKKFKREILVSANTAELMRNLLHFFDVNASQLPLKVLNQPGLREELRAFEIDNKITSRKTIERLLEEFGGTSRRG